jgi:hypothetical protein
MKPFDSDKFTKWINRKFDEARTGKPRYKAVDFARSIPERQQTVNYWLLGKLTDRPSDDACNRLIAHFGFEAYGALSLDPPLEEEVLSLLPKEEASRLISALEELRNSGINKGKEKASPEDRRKIIDIFSKHGVRFNDLIL